MRGGFHHALLSFISKSRHRWDLTAIGWQQTDLVFLFFRSGKPPRGRENMAHVWGFLRLGGWWRSYIFIL